MDEKNTNKNGKIGKKLVFHWLFSVTNNSVLPKRLMGSRTDTGFTVRWNRSLFIDSKLSAVQAPGDEWASGSACLRAFSLQYICDAGADRDSFTLVLHYKHHNSVVFQAPRYVYEQQLPQLSGVTQSCPGTDESWLMLHHKAQPAPPKGWNVRLQADISGFTPAHECFKY